MTSKLDSSPADARPDGAPVLAPAATIRRPSWQRKVAYALTGALAALGFGAGFGTYAALLDHDGPWRHPRVDVMVTAPSVRPALLEPAPAPAAAVPAKAPVELAFVAHAERPWALLDLGFDEAWLRGDARVVPPGDDDFVTFVTREVDVAEVPAEALDALGSELTLYDDRGEVCRARVARLAALGRYADGGFVGDQADRWQLAEGSHALAAELVPVAGDCAEARWARSSSLPAPEMAEVVAAPEALAAQAIDAFRSRDDHRELQRAFEADGGSGHWDEYGGAQVEVRLVRGSGTPIVVAEVAVGGCGTFEGSLVALWRLESGGELAPIPLAAERAPLGIDAAADLDFDGYPELFYRPEGLGDGALRGSEASYREAEAFEVPYHGCHC